MNRNLGKTLDLTPDRVTIIMIPKGGNSTDSEEPVRSKDKRDEKGSSR